MERSPRFPSLFYHQDLSSFALPFVATVLAWQLLCDYWILFAAAAFLAAALCCGFLRDARRICALILVGISAGALFVGVNLLAEKDRLSRDGAKVSGQGIVLQNTEKGSLVFFLPDGEALPFVVLTDKTFTLGVKIRGEAELSAAVSADIRTAGAGFAARGEMAPAGADPVLCSLGNARERFLGLWKSGSVGGFYRAALLGDRTGLGNDLKKAFRSGGAMHLLAVSGLHVSLILGALYYTLFFLTRDRRLTRIVMLFSLPAIAVLTGGALPVLRAVLMTGTALTVSLSGRRPAPLTGLSLAALILTLARPWAVGSASFLLTFSCTLGIIAAAGPLTRRLDQGLADERPVFRRAITAAGGSLFISLTAFVFTLPCQVFFFGTAQPFAALYNIFLIPLFTPCVALGLLSLPAAYFPALAFLRIPARAYGEFFLNVIRFVGDGALGTSITLGAMAPFCAMLALLVIALSFAFRVRCDRFLVLSLFLMAAVFLLGLFF